MLSNKEASLLKIDLLSERINFDIDIFEDCPHKFYDNQFVYGQTSKSILNKHRFPQLILLSENVNCALLRKETSSYTLLKTKNKIGFELYRGDKFITEINLPERPAYFDKTLSDGRLSQSIITVSGADTVGFFFCPDCYYFCKGKPCSFCGIKSTRNTLGKHLAREFSDSQIQECIELIEAIPWKDIPLYSITTGSPETDSEYREKIIKPIRAMTRSMRNKTRVHLLAHPPHDLDLLHEIYDAGVTSIALNLEIFNADIFKRVCRGKSELYGYSKWMDSLFAAKKIWGEYKVFCGLVWGLEPIEDTIAGNKFMAENGIGVASNLFHADAKAILLNHPHQSAEDIFAIAKELEKLYEEFPNMKTAFDTSMRSTLDWEIKSGFLK